ncbi:MAG: glucose-1-phosphate thymidylyltransferase [Bacteroidetes bacterium CG2_30_32_10]|nr:MAG: glucose-1-phosphate thymidylyltransferase [Bacteroidetes bacterium CG2_30_32_10]
MNYILFDDYTRNNLLPFTFTKPVADIRFGILTIREKWERFLNCKTSSLTENYLSIKFPLRKEEKNTLINGSFCPNNILVDEIINLKTNQALVFEDSIIALHLPAADIDILFDESADNLENIESKSNPLRLQNLWDIFSKNGEALNEDFIQITKNRKSAKISNTNKLINANDIFAEEDAIIEYATLNATAGPIYIGKNAEIMEGSAIRGSFALCENATVKMNAKIYGPTTIGPYSKVGGEINNSVIFGYSNKAHDGFLGNSVIGEWCNLGADTNNSNLKNNYDEVKLWNYPTKKFIKTGMQFCGLFMGDHSKCGINTMFNTGTVVGANANIFGDGFQRNFIPSFSWGGTSGFVDYDIDKAIEVAERVYQRRNLEFTDTDKNILKYIFLLTKGFRKH